MPSILALLVLVVKATVLLLLALAATVVMRRASAGARHLVWLVVLGVILVLPLLDRWSPLHLAVLPGLPTVGAAAERTLPVGFAHVPVVDPVTSSGPGGVASDPDVQRLLPAPESPGRGGGAPGPGDGVRQWLRSGASVAAPVAPSVVDAAFIVWFAVALVLVCWLGRGVWVVKRIVGHACPLEDGSWRVALYEVADRLRLERAPRLVVSDDVRMPFACGLVSPTVVLPRDAQGWDDDRRRVVLLHELGHVRRRDLVGHTLGHLACALYWFHPLVWTAARRLRVESERACDDLAIESGARASDYAEHLLDIVSSVRTDVTLRAALAMARRTEFEGRLLAVLDPALRRRALSGGQAAALVGGLVAFSLSVAALAPVPRTARAAVRDSRFEASGGRASVVSGSRAGEVEQRRMPGRMVARAGTTRSSVEHSSRSELHPLRGAMPVVDHGADAGAPVVGAASAWSPAQTIARRDSARPPVGGIVSTGRRLTSRASDPDTDTARRVALLAGVLRSDTSAELRRVAAWGLSRYSEVDAAADALSVALRRDSDAAVREMAAWSLVGVDRPGAVEALSAAARSDGSPKVRATAAWSLGQTHNADAAPVLAAALRDTSGKVRAAAAWGLGTVHAERAPRELLDALADRDRDVRERAAWALYEIRDPAAEPALSAALEKETSEELRRDYIYALAALGERSTAAIERLIESNDRTMRDAAVRALAGGGGYRVWPMPWPDPRPFP